MKMYKLDKINLIPTKLLIKEVSKKSGLTVVDVREAIMLLVKAIAFHVHAGKTVYLSGLGSFSPKVYNASGKRSYRGYKCRTFRTMKFKASTKLRVYDVCPRESQTSKG